MIPTFAQVRTRSLALLDDDTQAVFTDTVMVPAIGEAYEALYSAFQLHQIPKAKAIVTYTLAANVSSLTPLTAGINDFGELIRLEERRAGTADKYTPVWDCDNLPQRDTTDRLINFEWHNDTFYFPAATTSRELRITYFTSCTPPDTISSTSVGVDGSLSFLAKYAAGTAAPRKGYYELGEKYMLEAVGPKYDLGIIGGELLRFLTPMIRSRQRVTWARLPFSAVRRLGGRRLVPYVAAQAGTTGGSSSVPMQFSTVDGTITGTVNGVNLTFYLPYAVTRVSNLSVAGSAKTQGASADYTSANNVIIFTAGHAPATGPITCEGYL